MHYMLALLVLEVALLLVCLVGDHLLVHCQVSLVKAVADRLLHGYSCAVMIVIVAVLLTPL